MMKSVFCISSWMSQSIMGFHRRFSHGHILLLYFPIFPALILDIHIRVIVWIPMAKCITSNFKQIIQGTASHTGTLPGVHQPPHKDVEIKSILCHTFRPMQMSHLLQSLKRCRISVFEQTNPALLLVTWITLLAPVIHWLNVCGIKQCIYNAYAIKFRFEFEADFQCYIPIPSWLPLQMQ